MIGDRRPTGSLRRLRIVLWTWLAGVSAVAIAIVGVVLVQVDTGDRRGRQDVELKGRADRAAALMFTENGEPQISAVADDAVSENPARLVVFGSNGRVLFRSTATGDVPIGALASLAAASRGDTAENGRRTTVATSRGELRAVAMPWFGENSDILGSVVALGYVPVAADSELLGPSVVSGVLLWLVLLLAAWLVTGRSVRPAVDALATREAFLATAAHELRTPLARLRAGAETIERSAGPDDQRREALTGLVSMADSATHVVNNLLLAASIDWATPSVHRRLQRIDPIVADLEHRDPAVVVDVSRAVSFDADVHLVRHALVNLVDNALRHARAASDEPLVLVTLRADGATVEIEVRDNGAGFPADRLAEASRAPVRFETGAAGGTGLGLPLVAWIAGVHGGRLTVANVPPPDTGGCVTIVLPRR